MANEPITGLPYQDANTLQTDELQNEQLNYFAAWFGTVVQTLGDIAPPGSPVNGHCYIIGASATGAWASKDKYLTVYRDGWQFYAPKEGARVSNLADGKLYVYMGGAWVEYTIPVSAAAEDVSYDNTASSLAATDVQAAIDEIAGIAGITEAPTDGKQYARKNAAWAEVTAPAPTINIVTTITSGTITPAGDTDLVRPAALSAALTIANPSSTPADGAGFVVDLIDDGTTRALTWGGKYASRMATMPTTTTVSKRHRIGFEYNAADDKLYCMYAQVQP